MHDPSADAPAQPDGDPPAVVVYWRPGCFFCSRLFHGLERAGVVTERRNIWEDDEARRFVSDHNRGNETVPTVTFGGEVLTNPSPAVLIESLRATYPRWGSEPAPSRARRLFGR